jgi:hypothetical protein
MRKKSTYFILLFFVFLVYKPLKAQLIFNETFSSPIGNLEGSNGGTGFTTPWSNTTTGNTGATSLAQIVPGQIGATGSSGDKLQVTLPTGATTIVRYDRTFSGAALNNDASTQEYWLGFWLRIPAANISTSTYGVAAQIMLMNGANSSTATDMRLGFGKTSNYASGANSANAVTMFTRASPNGCAALNFPAAWNTSTSAQQSLIGLSTATDNVIYVLANIKKLEFPNYQQPSTTMPNPNPIANFDGFRYWIMSAPPTGANDPIFTTYPNGHISQIEPVTGNSLPLQNRMLRLDNNLNTTCVKDGVTGLRIRVEGNPGATPFLVEFDEIRLGTSLNSVLLLPIKLKDITAVQKGNSNIINWTTSTETNNKGFYIEQSNNARNWKNIGFVAGATNSYIDQNYSFTDNNPFDVTYYRIRQTDIDGKNSYTKTVKVDRNDKSTFTLSPNPTKDNINIKLTKVSNNSTAIIYNTIGKIVLQDRFSGNSRNINLSSLAKGIYYIKLNTTSGSTTEKIIKD